MAEPDNSSVGEEDAKLLTLARASRARTGAAEGAAVRDETGRTYAATTVALQSLKLSALKSAVAAAIASGAERLEGAVVVTSAAQLDAADVAVVSELKTPGAMVHRVEPSGHVVESVPL